MSTPGFIASSDGVPQNGTILAGKYRVIRKIGAGGMGAVVAAEEVATGRMLAVKTMLPALVESEEHLARFLREARAAESLASAHVAKVLGVGQLDDGAPYIAMELLEGQNLDEVLREKAPLGFEFVVDCVIEACDALAEAHAHGIVHRDLKPSNLFLARPATGSPTVKVLDFGVSKTRPGDAAMGDQPTLTETGSTLGSPQYMSPEQLRNSKNVDARSDIWSLGVVVHKLLTAKLPFESDSMSGHLVMVVADPPTPLCARRIDAPKELERVVLRCLEKNPAHRFASVSALCAALVPFASAAGKAAAARVLAAHPLTAEDMAPPMSQAPTRVLPPKEGGAGAPAEAVTSGDSPTAATWGRNARPGGGGARTGLAFMVGALVIGGLAAFVLLPNRAATPAVPPLLTATAAAAVASSAPLPAPLAAASATAAAVTTVTIRLRIEPRDAVVELDGAPTTDASLSLPRASGPHHLVVKAPGFLPESRELASDGDAELAVTLHRGGKVPDAPAPRTASPAPTAAPAPPATSKAKSKGPMEETL